MLLGPGSFLATHQAQREQTSEKDPPTTHTDLQGRGEHGRGRGERPETGWNAAGGQLPNSQQQVRSLSPLDAVWDMAPPGKGRELSPPLISPSQLHLQTQICEAKANVMVQAEKTTTSVDLLLGGKCQGGKARPKSVSAGKTHRLQLAATRILATMPQRFTRYWDQNLICPH